MLAGALKAVTAAAALCEGRDALTDLQEAWGTLEVPPRMTEALTEATQAAATAARIAQTLSDMALAVEGTNVAAGR